MKNISIIVAVDINSGIGKNNKLLCNIPEDLKRFKKITTGHDIIMGKNTFLSLPNGALPNRRNIVLTDDKNDKFENCIMVFSIEEALKKCNQKDEVFVIGGASIYKQFLEHANKLYLTMIDYEFEADTFFPEVQSKDWQEISMKKGNSDEKSPYEYYFVTYSRK